MDTIYKKMATTLRDLRKQRGWSLDKASQRTGVSKAMLGQIEREESSPTIATLWKIATGFDTSFSSFIDDGHREADEDIIHRGVLKTLHPYDKNIQVFPLFPLDPVLKFELFLIKLLPGCEHLSSPHQRGVIEHIVVVEGEVEIFVDNAWQPMSKGEGIKFDASQPHGYRNRTEHSATIHDIIHYRNS